MAIMLGNFLLNLLQGDGEDTSEDAPTLPSGKDFTAALPQLKVDDFMCEPVSGLDVLRQGAMNGQMKYKMELWVSYVQAVVIRRLQQFERNKKFKIDRWERPQGGGGVTCILGEGDVFERAGVNVSSVHGPVSEGMLSQMRSRNKQVDPDTTTFFATGVSCVVHPVNPFVPTMHFNYRYFELATSDGTPTTWWFGGGTDSTPTFVMEEDFTLFHESLKTSCAEHPAFYPRFKKWADEYFYSPHRKEHRGIGGMFFDDLDELPSEECFGFIASCCDSILKGYVPIISKRMRTQYTEKQRKWQLLRRGRYVEFNLLHDRGTKFGLFTPGTRIESILMSLPSTACWEYMYEPDEDEAKMLHLLQNPRDWV